MLRRGFASLTREQRITKALQAELEPSMLKVEDLSGGCDGGTIRINVVSKKFVGKTVVAQHQMVNKIIADEMKTLHACIIQTAKPKD